MNLRHVRAFQVVVETGSVTRAAEILDLTQPAVSKMISSFEKQVGYRLFDRDRGRLVPTEEAIHLSREVEEVFIAVDRLERRISEPANTATPFIRIASLPGAANYLVPTLLHRLGPPNAMPSVQLVTVGSSVTMRQYVASQQYDVAIMNEPLATPDYSIIERPQPIVCVMNRSDELSEKSVVTPSDLAEKCFASVGPRSPLHDALVIAFSQHGVKYDPHIEVQTHLPIVGIVASGLGCGLVDTVNAWTLREFISNDDIVIRRFEPAVYETMAICSPSLRPLSETAERFIALLADGLNETAELGRDLA